MIKNTVLVDRADLIFALYTHSKEFTDEQLKAVAESGKNPIYELISIGMNISEPNHFTWTENVDYVMYYLDRVAQAMDISFSNEEKNILLLEMLRRYENTFRDEMAELRRSVIDADVEEFSWLWTLRENIRYIYLGDLLATGPMDYEKIAEMTAILKPNRDKYEELLHELIYNGVNE